MHWHGQYTDGLGIQDPGEPLLLTQLTGLLGPAMPPLGIPFPTQYTEKNGLAMQD